MIKPVENTKPAVAVVNKTDEFFGESTPLKSAEKHGGPVYETRPQQMAMAHQIAEALEECHNLCVEAPTGVGKSFAYLVPIGDDSSGTGYDVILWIEKEVVEDGFVPPKIFVHSANVSARKKMELGVEKIIQLYENR